MTLRTFSLKLVSTLILLCCISSFTFAQFLRTSYLMDNAHYRMQLNPALTPERGYIDIPVIGNLNFAVSSSTLGSMDVIEVFKADNGDFTGDVLYNRLKDSNPMNLAFNTDVVSIGWWKGKNFWSVNAGLRLDAGALIPKSMFTFLRDMQDDSFGDWNNYSMNIENEKLYLNAYSEIGLGFARVLNERLTVGGKLKLLLGIGNLKLDINKINVETSGLSGNIENVENWNNNASAKLIVDARMESSLSGMKFIKDEDGFISSFDYKGFGIAGYGGAIDLGLTFKALNNLTLSAAITDLGFISWSKGSSSTVTAETLREYDKDNYEDFVNIVNGGNLLSFDLFGLKHSKPADARTTTLYSTITAGVEYTLADNKFALGAFSTTRMLKPETQSELTLGAAFRPASWFNLAASYSIIQSAGSTFGLAMKLGPLFVGTDYMYLGKNTQTANAFVGITIPLAAASK